MATTFERVSIRDVQFMTELEVLEDLNNIKIEIKELKRLTKQSYSNMVQFLPRNSALINYREQLYKRKRTLNRGQTRPRQRQPRQPRQPQNVVMTEQFRFPMLNPQLCRTTQLNIEVKFVENEEILEKECPICMEEIAPNNMVNIPCSSIKHHLCLECVTHLIKTPGGEKKCPICREEIAELEVNCARGEEQLTTERYDVKELMKSCKCTQTVPFV